MGVWADESADIPGCRNALAVLDRAVERCADEDMRSCAEVAAALAYLAANGHGKRVRAFDKALNVPTPQERRHEAETVLRALRDDAPGLNG